MFAAFMAAIAAILVACIVTSNRKHMLVAEEKKEKSEGAPKSDTVKTAETVKKVESKPAEATPQKNSGAVNAILYIGCFLVVASFMGFCSYVDDMLVPPVVIAVTILALFASIMLRLFSPLLKASSIAFNISALLMFFFWFPSLEALGFDGAYMPLFVFSMAFIASVISATVFKDRGLWSVPFIVFIPLIISLFVAIGSSLDYTDTAACLAFYGVTIFYFIAAIVCRYLWRSHSSILPIPVRSSVLVFSYIYLIAGILVGLSGMLSEVAPFIGVTTLVLALVVFFIDYKLAGKNKTALRIGAFIATPILCFDILALIEAEYPISATVLVFGLVVTAVINAIISFVIMLKRPTENAHRVERVIMGLCIAALSIACFCGMSFKDEFSSISSYYAYPIYMSEAEIARLDPASYTTAMLVAEIVSIVSALVFSAATIFIDRNATMLIPASLILGAALSDPAIDNNLFTGITLGILSLVAAFAYFAVRAADEKTAMTSSIISSISLAVISFFYCIGEGSFFWLPILLASVIVLIFGYTSKKVKTIDFGYYILAFAFAMAIVDICTNLSIPEVSKNALYEIAWLAVPFAVLIRDLLHDIAKGKTNKNAAEFYLGTIFAWIFTGGLNLFYSMMVDYSGTQYIYAMVIFIARVLLMLDCFRKKIVAMEVISVVFLVFTVISFVGINMWVILLITGLCLIGVAIFAIYRAAKKPVENAEQNAIPEATQPAPEQPSKTEIQSEKTEDIDKKTVA